jgi:hypothetical protein
VVRGRANWTHWRFGCSAYCCYQAYKVGIGCDQVRLGLQHIRVFHTFEFDSDLCLNLCLNLTLITPSGETGSQDSSRIWEHPEISDAPTIKLRGSTRTMWTRSMKEMQYEGKNVGVSKPLRCLSLKNPVGKMSTVCNESYHKRNR